MRPSRYNHHCQHESLECLANPGVKFFCGIVPEVQLRWAVLFLFAARFSPDDKFSKQRMTCKRRFGLLPTQGPPHKY
ncbi:unnamed protein product [Calypogeia fissa]